MDAKHVREAGDILCRQASADAKTLGPGSISQANRQRAQWGLTIGGNLFPSSAAVPTVRDLGAFVVALGLDIPSYSERVARYVSGPIAELLALAEGVKARRPRKRVPGYLSVARARTWELPVDLAEGALKTLEEIRFDDPRAALKATREALKTVSGPIAVGRVLAIHASNLREVDELGEALLAVRVAIPALDLAGDTWGMGRVIMEAAAVIHVCGRFTLARALVDEAEAFYVRADCPVGRSVAMLARASIQFNADASGPTVGAALRELSAALGLLPETALCHIATAYQLRACILARVGDLEAARTAAQAAAAVAPDAPVLRGRIRWIQGDIEAERGCHVQAETLYREAFGLVAEPLCDRLLLAASAVRMASCSGGTARALTTAKTLLGPMFETLDDTDSTHSMLRAAHADLYSSVLTAGLSVAVVDKAIHRIEAARTARSKHLRRQV